MIQHTTQEQNSALSKSQGVVDIIPPAELIGKLNSLPRRISEAQIKVAKLKEELEKEKAKYDVIFSSHLISSQASNATQKKAEATVKSEDDKIKVINASFKYEHALAGLKAQENQFVAFRKIAQIQSEGFKTQVL
jgi:hypothetical protein